MCGGILWETKIIVYSSFIESFLVACQSQKAPEETTTVETTTETTTTTVSTTVEVKPDYSLYDGIISKYATVTKNSKGDVDQSINTIAYLLRNNEIYTGIDYALYDLDKTAPMNSLFRLYFKTGIIFHWISILLKMVMSFGLNFSRG